MLTAGVPTIREVHDSIAAHRAHVKEHGEIRIHDPITPMRKYTPEEEENFRQLGAQIEDLANRIAVYTKNGGKHYTGSPLYRSDLVRPLS